MKKIIISQPRYLPAINYLQRLYNADLFVFLDTVQRQGRGWENRNKILQNEVESWVTIPITSSSREIIYKTKISGTDWIEKHKFQIKNAYKEHPFYSDVILNKYYEGVFEVLINSGYSYRDAIVKMIMNACEMLNYSPIYSYSTLHDDGNSIGVQKLVDISKNVDCDVYVSGANGREYGVTEAFYESGIRVAFHNFSHPQYKQYNAKAFHPWMSFIDVIFNIGLKRTEEIVKKEWNLIYE